MRLGFRSINGKLVTLTTILIAATVALVVWQWTSADRALVLTAKRDEARTLADTLSHMAMNEVDDANWNSIRVDVALLMKREHDIAYVVVHDAKAHDRIAVQLPEDPEHAFVPDQVSLATTRAALATNETREARVNVLRDVVFEGGTRATRGEGILELATPVLTMSGARIATMRVGISLAEVRAAERAAIEKAVILGAIAMVGALLGALVVARTLVTPLRRLADDARVIAGGKLGHRAAVDDAREDEIGELARGFNAMSADLQASFGKLEKTLASFQRFVPQKFLAVIAPEGIENITVGTAQPRNIAVLFTDLRGFTAMSEGLTPIQVFNLLNEYLAVMGDAIDRAGGFVDKYIGDAIMALFDEENADSIVRAIVYMRQALGELNVKREARGEPPIKTGIGAHGGSVVMGTIGFASKIESTVIGDAVNVASRVESMTKDHHVDVLITGDLVARLANPDAFPLKLVEKAVSVRGRDEPIDLYTLELG
jgi:class 3 adenylate cyclase/HAMP domain-containing protein